MDNIKIKAIGERIKAERTREGYSITLDTLADKIGVTRQTISKWEKGEGTGPTVWDLVRLCEFFGCDYGYLIGDYACRTRIATDIREETGLSELAVTNLLIAAGGPDEGEMKLPVAESPRDNLRSYEIGRFAKIRFIEALLEHTEELERLAVAAYDYRRQMQLYGFEPNDTVEGIRHDQFADVAKGNGKEALADLFKKIEWDIFNGPEWTGK